VNLEQIFLDNAGRNFNYIVACPVTGQALAVDPLDADRVLEVARAKNYRITHILSTHEHPDHTGGNEKVRQATGAVILAHEKAKAHIGHVQTGLVGGEIIQIGEAVRLKVLDTPGHTMAHLCLLSEDSQGAQLLCGDTLFNAGAGNCHQGGHPKMLYQTFAHVIATLADETRVYPGHDYILNNLRFALSREPGNQKVQSLLDTLSHSYNPHRPYITTIGLEKAINPFLRLDSAAIRKKLHEVHAIDSEEVSDEMVFLALRELRNRF
jgi:hydroxyacylglutathione hydrolase